VCSPTTQIERIADHRRQINALAHFGAGITQDKKVKTITDVILEPLYYSAIVSNDYFSWEVESAGSTDRTINCVAFLTQWHSLSVTEAKEFAKAKCIGLEQEYLDKKAEYLAGSSGSSGSQSILDSLELMEAVIAGLSLWNTTCPRYHPSRLSENVYEAYFQSRVGDGFRFFDFCTESAHILSSESDLVSGPQKINGLKLLNNAQHTDTFTKSLDPITEAGSK